MYLVERVPEYILLGAPGGGDPGLLQRFLEAGADPNTIDSLGEVSLSIAIKHRRYRVASRLLELSLKPQTFLGTRCYRIIEALIYNCNGVMEEGLPEKKRAFNVALSQCLEKMPDTNFFDRYADGLSLMELSYKNNALLVVQTYIGQRKKNLAQLRKIHPILVIAAEYGDYETCKTILAVNGLPDQTNFYGETPLFRAAKKGHVSVCELFLRHEANPNKERTFAHITSTPFLEAVLNKKLTVATLMLNHGANIDHELSGEKTLLHSRAFYGEYDVCNFLLTHGANPNRKAKGGYTPLHFAAFGGHLGIYSLIRAHPKTDVTIKDDNGCTAEQIWNQVSCKRPKKESHKPVIEGGGRVYSKFFPPVNKRVTSRSPSAGSSLLPLEVVEMMTPLMVAAQEGNVAALKRCLKTSSTDLNKRLENGMSALMLAVQNRHIDCVEELTKHPGVSNYADQNGKDVFAIAVESGAAAILNVVLKHFIKYGKVSGDHFDKERLSQLLNESCRDQRDVNVIEVLINHGASMEYGTILPLAWAICNADFATVKLLLSKGASKDKFVTMPRNADEESRKGRGGYLDKQGTRFLHIATARGTREIMDLIYSPTYDIDVKTKSEEADTPLLSALRDHNIEGVAFCIEHGANVDYVNGLGHSALFIAVKGGNVGCVRLLLEKKVTPKNDDYSLHYAAQNNYVDILRLLIEYGEDVNKKHLPSNGPPLYFAVKYRAIEAAKVLVEKGADTNVPPPSQVNIPLVLWAWKEGYKDLVEVILKAQPFSGTSSQSKTPLHWACYNVDEELVICLLKYNPRLVNVSTKNGVTPLLIAVGRESLTICEILLKAGANLILFPVADAFPPAFCAEARGYPELAHYLTEQTKKAHQLSRIYSYFIYKCFTAPIKECVGLLKYILTTLPATQKWLELELIEFYAKAISLGYEKIVRVCWEAAPLLHDCLNKEGLSGLSTAVKYQKGRLIDFFLGNDVDVDSPNRDGSTPLMIASQVGSVGIVRTLLAAGASKEERNQRGETPLSLAVARGHSDLVGFLCDDVERKQDAFLDAVLNEVFKEEPHHYDAGAGSMR